MIDSIETGSLVGISCENVGEGDISQDVDFFFEGGDLMRQVPSFT